MFMKRSITLSHLFTNIPRIYFHAFVIQPYRSFIKLLFHVGFCIHPFFIICLRWNACWNTWKTPNNPLKWAKSKKLYRTRKKYVSGVKNSYNIWDQSTWLRTGFGCAWKNVLKAYVYSNLLGCFGVNVKERNRKNNGFNVFQDHTLK